MKVLSIIFCVINSILAFAAPLIAAIHTDNWLNLFFWAMFGPMVIGEWYVTLNACKK